MVHPKITKPVCLLLHGPSLEQLDIRIMQYRDLDVMWVSLNAFYICHSILDKIGKRLDAVVLLYSEVDGRKIYGQKVLAEAEKYQDRGGVIYENRDFYDVDPNIFDGNDGCPSFYFILLFLKALGAKDVFLYGADGWAKEGEKTYFNQDQVPMAEANPFGGAYPWREDLERVSQALYRRDPRGGMNIYNTVLTSAYPFFQKIGPDEAIVKIKELVAK